MTIVGKKYWFKKFFYAFKGIFSSIKEEKSMVIHLIISLIAIALSIALKINAINWIVIVLVIGFVLTTELLNTALENLVDTVSFEYNINAQKIKDTAAAATLIAAIISIIVSFLVFIPRIMEIVNGSY